MEEQFPFGSKVAIRGNIGENWIVAKHWASLHEGAVIVTCNSEPPAGSSVYLHLLPLAGGEVPVDGEFDAVYDVVAKGPGFGPIRVK